MKSPILLGSALSVLALAACSTAPSQGSFTPRHGRIVAIPAPEAPAPEPVVPPPAHAAASVSSAPVTVPVPVPPPAPPPPPVPVPVPAPVVVAPPPPPPAVVAPSFKALRSGTNVHLSWTIPENPDGYRGIEIMRNDNIRPTGRARVRAVRGSVTQLDDTLPDPSRDYWYWIKLTSTDGSVTNLGPFETTKAP